jgi:hypothetical protein
VNRHITTDPICREHRPPWNAFTRWRFDRNRGRICRLCALEAAESRLRVVADLAEDLEAQGPNTAPMTWRTCNSIGARIHDAIEWPGELS